MDYIPIIVIIIMLLIAFSIDMKLNDRGNMEMRDNWRAAKRDRIRKQQK
jgi:hypothetical protein